MSFRNLSLLLFFVWFPSLQFAGEHLEVMIPLAKQHDFKGQPESVVTRSFELRPGEERQLERTKTETFDSKGNLLKTTETDAAGKETLSVTYKYDENGDWISVTTVEDGTETVEVVKIDLQAKQITKINQTTKETDATQYTPAGFEQSAVVRSGTGEAIKKVVIERNEKNQEVSVRFEEPPGQKSVEVQVEWSAQGFQTLETLIFHQRGETFTMRNRYPEVDSTGNWLTKEVQRQATSRGVNFNLPVEIEEREITYHP